MMRCTLGWMLGLTVMLGAAGLPAQGITPKQSAVVLYGSTSNTTKPATIDYEKVEKKTPEYETIRSDGVRKGSARYNLLTSKMRKRIRAAVRAAAQAGGYDCVLREGDVKDDKGLDVGDLTDEVIEELESDASVP